jgi:hypothetical protein
MTINDGSYSKYGFDGILPAGQKTLGTVSNAYGSNPVIAKNVQLHRPA